MKIGLYFGSFNPIHIGHLIIANHIANHSDVNQIWFVVSPQNPLKQSAQLLNEYQRLHLVRVAIEDNPLFKASDIEFKLPKPSYTIDTLTYLQEKYPHYSFSVIMGGDSFSNITRWKNYSIILKDYPIIVYNRPGFDLSSQRQLATNITMLDAPLLDISATTIRTYIKQGKSIKYLVSDAVQKELIEYGYYK